jgi:hypothetical protein
MDDESKQFNLCSKGTTDRTGGVDERLQSNTSEALGFMAIPTASPSSCRGRTPHSSSFPARRVARLDSLAALRRSAGLSYGGGGGGRAKSPEPNRPEQSYN